MKKKLIALLAVFLPLALALSGCEMQMKVKINPDKTATMSMVMKVKKATFDALSAMSGEGGGEASCDMLTSEMGGEGDVVDKSTADELICEVSKPDAAPLQGDGAKLTEENGVWTLTLNTEGDSSFDEMRQQISGIDQMKDLMKSAGVNEDLRFTLIIEMPENITKVEGAEGTINGKEVSIDFLKMVKESKGDNIVVTADANAAAIGGSSSVIMWVLIGVGILVVIIIIVVVVVMASKKKKQQQQLMGYGQPMAAPYGQPMPPQGQPYGQPMPPQGQPVPPQGQPMPPQGQPVPPQGQPMPPQGQPMPPQEQPVPPQEQPAPPQEQPAPSQEQPMPPAPEAGQQPPQE